MSRLTEEQRTMFQSKLIDFFDEYAYLYSPEERYSIEYQFLGRAFEENFSIDIISEVYQEIGVFDVVTDNIYSDFYNTLTKHFDLNRRLLEVGCGILPSFAKKIARGQSSGTLTVIDPEVRLFKSDDFKMIREELTPKFDVSNYDLIYGIQPCGATLDTIKLANESNKDLCIILCNCCHLPYKRVKKIKNYTKQDWYNYVEEVIRLTLPKNRELIVEDSPSTKFPIYVTKKLTND